MSLIFYIITTRPNLFHKLIPLDDILARTILLEYVILLFIVINMLKKKTNN